MEPVPARELPHRLQRLDRYRRHTELEHVELDHHEQRQVVEDGGHRRHQNDVEVADLQELGDEKCRGAQHGRRNDRAEAARGEQPAGGLLAVARADEHRVGDRSDRHGGRNARARRPAEQKRREYDGASRAGMLAAHRGEAEIEEELARAGMLQERAVDREQNDERRRHLDRRAEDTFERLIQKSRHAGQVVASMRPLPGQPRTDEGVDEEGKDDAADDPAHGAAAGFEHQQHEGDAEEHIQGRRYDVAVPDVVAAVEQVEDGRYPEHSANDVPPHQPIAKARRDRKQEIDEEQHEADVHRPQHLRRHDLHRRVQVEEAHRDQQRRRDAVEPALEAADCAFRLFDEFFGFLQPLVGDERLVRWRCRAVVVGHGPVPTSRSRRVPQDTSSPPDGMAAASRPPDS